MAHALHHYLRRKNKGRFSILDRAIYVSAFGGPLLTIPQVLKIFGDKNATGISLIYWLGILAGALLWGSYGLVHKEKPIMVANALTIILATAIITGVVIYGRI